MWVASTDRIMKLKYDGELLVDMVYDASTEVQGIANATELACDSQNNLWLVDSDNDRVLKFDSNGNFVIQFGQVGSGTFEFDTPQGIAIDTNNNIYVSDSGSTYVKVFKEKLIPIDNYYKPITKDRLVYVDIKTSDKMYENPIVKLNEYKISDINIEPGITYQGLIFISGILKTDELDIINSGIEAYLDLGNITIGNLVWKDSKCLGIVQFYLGKGLNCFPEIWEHFSFLKSL